MSGTCKALYDEEKEGKPVTEGKVRKARGKTEEKKWIEEASSEMDASSVR